jgi:hypothetical protein
MYCEKKLFKQLNVGDVFAFSFDAMNWRYKKVEFDRVQCVKCPAIYNVVGQVDEWKDQEMEVFHFLDKIETMIV